MGGHRAVGRVPAGARKRPYQEVQTYLDRCSFGSLVIYAENQLTVTLLDPDQNVWTFLFRNAGLSVSP